MAPKRVEIQSVILHDRYVPVVPDSDTSRMHRRDDRDDADRDARRVSRASSHRFVFHIFSFVSPTLVTAISCLSLDRARARVCVHNACVCVCVVTDWRRVRRTRKAKKKKANVSRPRRKEKRRRRSTFHDQRRQKPFLGRRVVIRVLCRRHLFDSLVPHALPLVHKLTSLSPLCAEQTWRSFSLSLSLSLSLVLSLLLAQHK